MYTQGNPCGAQSQLIALQRYRGQIRGRKNFVGLKNEVRGIKPKSQPTNLNFV